MAPAPLVLIASGLAAAAALAAQLLWMRALGRAVSGTPALEATMLATFVVGLGLGALIGSRIAPRSSRPSRVAAIVLALAGVWIATSPLLLDLVATFAAGLDGPPSPLSGAHLCALVLLVPAILFGSIYPLLVRSRVVELSHAAGRSGRLYACYAIGAALGALFLFVLLPRVGEQALLLTTPGLALIGAMLLLMADRPLPHGSGPPAESYIGTRVSAVTPALAVAMAGAAAIGAEAAWLEVLEPLTGSTPVALTILLVMVGFGLAFGYLLGGAISPKIRRADLALGFLLALAGYLLILPLPFMGDLPKQLMAAGNPTGGERISILVWGMLMVLLPASICLGAVFPLAVRARADWTGEPASAAGRMYAWNAAGHVIGAIVIGLLLRPALGADGALMCVGFVAVAVAAGMRLFSANATRLIPTIAIVLPLVIWLMPGAIDSWREAQPTLPEIAATRRPMPRGLEIRDQDDVTLYAEMFVGRLASRTRKDDAFRPPYRGMGGPVDALATVEGPTELVRRGHTVDELEGAPGGPPAPAPSVGLGLVPALLHPSPERALVIGYGAGWTTRATLAARIARVDVAEAHPSVVHATEDWFGADAVLGQESRVEVELADGRSMLRAYPDTYDVVVAAEPEGLLTIEGLETAKRGLTDDGVIAFRVVLGDYDADGLRSLFVTARTVFDHVQVWRFRAEMVLVCSPAPLVVRSGRWRSVWMDGGPAARLASAAGMDQPADLLRHIALDTGGVDRVAPKRAGTFIDDVPRPAKLRLDHQGRHGLDGILAAGFPPDFVDVIPDVEARELWLPEIVRSWLDIDLGVATLWARVPLGRRADAQRVRGDVARARGEAQGALHFYTAAMSIAPDDAAIQADRILALPASVGPRADSRDAVVAEIDEQCVAYHTDGRVQAAAAQAYAALGLNDRAADAYRRALAATDPPAPRGTGVRFGRFLIAQTSTDPAEAQRAMESDPVLYEDAEALEFYMTLLDPVTYAKREQTLQAALDTLELDRAVEAQRMARRYLGRLEFDAASRYAAAWTRSAPTDANAWTTLGLASLALVGERAADKIEPTAAAASISAFRTAITQSASPEQTRARLARILGWYGLPANLLDAASGPGGN